VGRGIDLQRCGTQLWTAARCSHLLGCRRGTVLSRRHFLDVCLRTISASSFLTKCRSSWYKRSELAVRIAWFYSGNALANMFGGLIAAGVLGNLEGAHGIGGWRWLL
jgi:hypothetical protein